MKTKDLVINLDKDGWSGSFQISIGDNDGVALVEAVNLAEGRRSFHLFRVSFVESSIVNSLRSVNSDRQTIF
jgi:hypothetical protein